MSTHAIYLAQRTTRRSQARLLVYLLSALLLTIPLLPFGAAPAAAANPPPVQYFYVPFPENQLLQGLQAIESGGAGTTPASPVTTYISIAAVADGTIVYYDQWENGYDADIANPGNLYSAGNPGGTQIWGDGNTANGAPPGVASDLINAGTVIILNNAVDTSTQQSVIDWDGRDKFAATKYIAVTRTSWASGSSTLLAGSVEVYDTNLWGTLYRAPVGENIPDTTDYQMFEYTGLAIMAGAGGATISVDANADGDYLDADDVNGVTIAEGVSRFVNGGVNVGARVVSNKPVQVDILTGDIASNYESRDSALLPVALWSSNYYTPVSTPDVGTGDSRTTVWLYNSGTSAITVTYQRRDSSGNLTASTITVAAGGYAKQVLDNPTNGTGSRFYTTTGAPFYAFSTTDSASSTYSDNQAWDWGFSLIPETSLTPQVLVGLGIGRDPTSSVNPHEDGNPVWVTTVGNPTTAATVYADCDADPTTGANIDPNGNHYDVAYSLKELEQAKVYGDDTVVPGSISHDATSSGTTGTSNQSTSLSIAHTTGTAANRLMLVGVAIGNDSTVHTVSSVMYGVTPLTLVGGVTSAAAYNGARSRTEIWALANPPSGTANVTVTLTGARTFVTGVTTFSGVDVSNGTTSALGTYNSASASSGTTHSVVVSTTAGQVVYDVVGATNLGYTTPGAFTTGADQTERWQQSSVWSTTTDRRNRGAGSTETATGSSTTMSWTTSTSYPWAIGAVPIVPMTYPHPAWTCPAGDQTGMLLYTLDAGVKLAAAWGQDPTTASAAEPGLDVGTSVPPCPLFSDGKNGTLWDDPATVGVVDGDKDGDGFVSPGDVLEYTIVINNISRAPMPDVLLKDNPPADTTYVTGSTYFTNASGVTTQIPDDGSGTAFPLDGSGYTFTGYSLPGGGSMTVTFRVTIDSYADLTPGTTELVDTGSATAVGITVPFEDTTPLYGRIGDRVWVDADGDGIQDAGESGLSGVTVKLYDSAGTTLLATTVTDGNGNYKFTGLLAGNYIVEFGKPTGYNFTVLNADGQGISGPLNSDANLTTGRTAVIALAAGEPITYVDAGLYKPATLGDRVWVDADGDGIQDGGESGLSGVTVRLYLAGGTTPISTTTTGAGGIYSFTNLTPGSYFVEFVKPSGYSFSPQDQGSNDALDSDANPSTGRTATTTLTSGESDTTWDAGLYQPAAIGDYVWVDADGDGIQDSGESGLSGVTVRLYLAGGTTPISTTTTGAGGIYSFTNLTPGSYFVEFVKPSGYVFSPQNQGSDPTKDSDPNASTGKTGTILLTSGQTNNTVDAGMYQTASLGDFVWSDTNANGRQDTGETGISGVTVNVYRAADNTLAGTPTTNASGIWSVTGLAVGNYYIVFVAPTGYAFSPQNQGSDPTKDSDPNPATGQTGTVTLTVGQNDTTWDAGLYQTTSISGQVREDQNANGNLADSGDPAIPGVTIELWTDPNGDGNPADGTKVGSTTTNASGYYNFVNITPGNYVVVELNLATYISSGDKTPPGTDDRVTVVLASGQSSSGNDFLDYRTATIGDTVWVDADGDGIQDAGEAGLSGVTVNVYRAADNSLAGTTTTNSSGIWSVSGLTPGDYYVKFVAPSGYSFSPQDQGSDDALDSDANPSTGQTATTTLTSGENDTTWDAGLYQLAAIGDRVWVDADADGIQDAGEAGLSGVTVNVYRAADNSLAGTTTTNSSGLWSVSGLLAPGNYYVEFVPPSGYSFSPQDQGSDDALDSDANPSTGQTATTLLTSGESDTTWDAGLYHPATIGDRVWVDADADGIQDAGEVGLSGVTVNVYRSADNSLAGTTTTNASGIWSVSGLVPGDYYVKFVAPSGYSFSPQDQGGDDTLDSDANPSTGQTATTTLTSGESDTTWDAGLYQPATLGDRVWVDADGDGIQDVGEVGLSGVTVNVYRAADNSLAGTTTTNSSGLWSVNGLVPGDYYVKFVAPSGYSFSSQDQGSDDALDSDANPSTGQTAATTLTSGESDTTWDAGLYQPATIGDYVWVDTDGDGIQDGGESGLSGVTVRLYQAGGTTPIATTTTGAGGLYSFKNVTPGSYFVEFVAPSGYSFSPQDQGGNDALDSDANPSTGQTATTTLTSGESDTTWDAGLYPPAAIGDYVWYDANGDGRHDVEEQGIGNITLALYKDDGDGVYDAGDTQVDSTFTDWDGGYLFTGLVPGVYFVNVTDNHGLLNGYYLTSGPQSSTDPTGAISVASGDTYREADFGYKKPTGPGQAVIGDYVWYDYDADGVQDFGEPGIPGVTVTVTDSLGITYSAVTDLNGNYQVVVTADGVRTYTVEPTAGLPGGLTATMPVPHLVPALQPGDQYLYADFGYDSPDGATISGTVWEDVDRDGFLDSGEPRLAGVSVSLLDPAGNVVATTTTDSSGDFSFTVLPGSYQVVVTDTQHRLEDYSVGPVTGNVGDNYSKAQPHPVTVWSGGSDNRSDFGYVRDNAQLGTIGNQVWVEVDGDGLWEPGNGELGIEGVTVDLYLNGVFYERTTTGASGDYVFTSLAAGVYTVTVTDVYGILTGYDVTTIIGGMADNTNKAQPYTIGLAAGDQNLTADFGYLLGVSYTVTKELWQTVSPVGVGQKVVFRIRIQNTGDIPITVLPLRDVYDNEYLTYGFEGQYSTPNSVDNVNDEQIDWSDLTLSFGQELQPESFFDVFVVFKAIKDTRDLPDKVTINTALVHDAFADLDGPGGLEPLPLDDLSDTASVQILQATGVTLASLAAVAQPGGVLVSWQTASEVGILGFNLLRSVGGEFVAVNQEFLFAQHAGANLGASYTYVDAGLPAGVYTYTLEVVMLDGRVERHGLVSVSVP